MPTRSVITIGAFDGVHAGHAALISRARAIADGAGRGRVVAMAFDPHPLVALRPYDAPALLTTFDRRTELLRAAGADEVIRLEPTAELLGLSPESFIERLIREAAPTAIVEGADFRFGKGRTGDIATLHTLGKRLGFETVVVDPVEVSLTDQSVITASSTLVRWLIAHGRVGDAQRVMGRPHGVTGVVVRGDRRGREIGYPTANVQHREALPADGVYAGRATLSDGRTFDAAIHVGPRATFDDVRRTVEAYLLDWKGPVAEGCAEYGWEIRLDIVSWLRDQAKFDSLDGLIAQIARDVERAREALGRSASASRGPSRLVEAPA